MKKHRIVFSLIMTLILSMSMAIPTFAASKVIKKTPSKGTAVVKHVDTGVITFTTSHRVLKAWPYGSKKSKIPNPRKKVKYNYKRENTFYKNGNVKVEYRFTKKGYYSGVHRWVFNAGGHGTATVKSIKYDKKQKRYILKLQFQLGHLR